jgi:hypothetical protein
MRLITIITTAAALAITMLGLSSCNNSSGGSTYSYSSVAYNIATRQGADSSTISKSAVNYAFNSGDNTIDIATTATPYTSSKTAGGTVSFSTTVDMTYDQTKGYFTFSTSNVKATGATVSGLSGSFDYITGTLYLEYTVNGTYTVKSTSSLAYPYTETQMIDTAHTTSAWTQNQAVYLFDVNTSTNKANISIYYIQTEKDGQNHVLQYSGAQVTPTRTGYVITADTLKAISDYKVYYLRNAKFTIDNNWHSLNGTFQLDNQQATVKGGLFN